MGPLENGDPERIGRYRLIGRLGSGGMGQVYFGRSPAGRAVAVKRIHPHLAADASFRDRFAREVTAARQVSGAFTAPVIDADPEAQFPWLVTSYVPSLPLDTAVERFGPLPEQTLRVLAVGLSEALSEIHRCGLVHRDLKPGNVLLAEDGPRVIDFGIARATEGTSATQSIIGTPGFMSPEQINGQPPAPSSDIFALGAVLTYAAAGAGPFGEGSMPTMVMRVTQNEPDISAVPPALQPMVAACLAKEERRRPAPGQILDAMGEVPIGQSWLPPHVMRAVHDQVQQVNTALAHAPAAGGATAAGATAVLGAAGAAGGAAAFGGPGSAGDQATRGMGPVDATGQMDAGATSMLPRENDSGGAAPTAVFGRDDQFAPPSTGGGGGPATQVAPGSPSDDDAYGDLYRGSPRSTERGPQQPYEDPRYAQQQRQEEERRRAEKQAHQDRVRAEREAARQAQRQARRANAPSLWRFATQLPLLIIPLIQIPLGIGAAYAWQWFTSTDVYWGAPWEYEGVISLGGDFLGFLSIDGFLHAMFLGYFLFNNLVGLSWLLRSLRSSFIIGVLLAAVVLVGTNAALMYFGFFG